MRFLPASDWPSRTKRSPERRPRRPARRPLPSATSRRTPTSSSTSSIWSRRPLRHGVRRRVRPGADPLHAAGRRGRIGAPGRRVAPPDFHGAGRLGRLRVRLLRGARFALAGRDAEGRGRRAGGAADSGPRASTRRASSPTSRNSSTSPASSRRRCGGSAGAGAPARRGRGRGPARGDLPGVQEGRRAAALARGLRDALQPRDRLQGDVPDGRGDQRVPARRKDPQRAVECCSMLGLCFLEKGMPQLAIKWYRKGLEAPGHQRARPARAPVRPRERLRGPRRPRQRLPDVPRDLRRERVVPGRRRAAQGALAGLSDAGCADDPPSRATAPLLSVRALTVSRAGPPEAATSGRRRRLLRRRARGESSRSSASRGCGKTLIGLALARPRAAARADRLGTIVLRGARRARARRRARRSGCGAAASGSSSRSPATALDPVRTIGSELVGGLAPHRGRSRGRGATPRPSAG